VVIAPVIVLAAGRAGSRRKISRSEAGITGLALTGLGLLVGLPSGGFREAAVLASAGLAVLAAAGFAAVTLAGSRPVPGLDDLTVTGFGFRPDAAAIGLLIALGTGPAALAYTLYFRGLRTAAASTAVRLALLEPLTGAILAALILGDRLGPVGIAGGAILAAAVILTVRNHRPG
jgi:DME family drug/metabolite transporter